jgi:hypothetical protein
MDGSTQITIIIVGTLFFSFLCSSIVGYAYAPQTVQRINITGGVLIIGGFVGLPIVARLALPAPFERGTIIALELALALGIALLLGLLLSLRFFRFQAHQQAKHMNPQ